MNDTAVPSSAHATLFYDGRCPLCVKEMAKLESLKSRQLQLADIHTLPAESTLPDKDTLLRNLHLLTPQGEMLTGVDANVAAWQYTRKGHWFRWMRWPLIGSAANLGYTLWARWRYNRLYKNSCADEKGSCDAP